MPEIQNPIAVETLLEALETMAFVALLPAEDAATPPAEMRHVSVSFTRPDPGRIELMAPAGLGRLLCANILGEEASGEQAVGGGDDALCELVNVTCGMLLSKRAQTSQEPFQMGIPAVRATDSAQEWASFVARPGVDVLDADGNTVAIQVTGVV